MKNLLMGSTILIVDDEADIRILVRYNLEKEGFVVLEADNGEKGIQLAMTHLPDLILLDFMMPGMDGMETCQHMRKIPELADTMICFLTARSEESLQISGLDAGADDYIIKPIKPQLLVSRIAALLRRKKTGLSKPSQAAIAGRSIEIDHEKYLVIKNGEPVTLPRREFELLGLLMSKPEKVFHREDIMLTVWGNEVIVGDRTLDVHIRKLREKLGDKHIITVKGVGYKFEY